MRILVLGCIVRVPLGGMAWHYLHYVLGLRKMGHDVYFFEDSHDYPSCYDPRRHVTDTDPTYGLRFTGQLFEQVDAGDRWAFYDAHADRWRGPVGESATEIACQADLLINVSGSNPIRPWFAPISTRVMVDTDPAFEQIRHLTDPGRRQLVRWHTHFFTFGENIPIRRALVPDDGLPWQATRQPIALEFWPAAAPQPGAHFTTVMQWERYPEREYAGVCYGQKRRSFEAYVDLPSHTGPILELALGSPSAPRDLLRSKGWHVTDPLEVTRDVWRYREYIQSSRGEFAIAKHGYVEGRTGWFSERSGAYLASGRPVVTQDTGFAEHLPTGEGLFAFANPVQAAEALARVQADYLHHCKAARRIAERYFDSYTVLDIF